jgi:hypothetical protein
MFFGESISNGAAGSGMEMIVSCGNAAGTMVIQHSTVMSGSNAGKIFSRRYLSGAWSAWTAI